MILWKEVVFILYKYIWDCGLKRSLIMVKIMIVEDDMKIVELLLIYVVKYGY